MTTGVLFINALKISTNRRQQIIIKFGLFGKNLNRLDNKLSSTLVWTTPCPRINNEMTVINEVLLNPLSIV
jgi:hypothetical protein